MGQSRCGISERGLFPLAEERGSAFEAASAVPKLCPVNQEGFFSQLTLGSSAGWKTLSLLFVIWSRAGEVTSHGKKAQQTHTVDTRWQRAAMFTAAGFHRRRPPPWHKDDGEVTLSSLGLL